MRDLRCPSTPEDRPQTETTDQSSAVKAWEMAHARCLAYDGQVQAVITWVDGSRRDAEATDARAAVGKSRGPLDGLLLGLKDNIDTAGVVTTAGAGFLRDNVPATDATVVQLLRRQGVVVLAKLNMAELAWGATTQNANYGSCRNPWDLDCIPGGSSGGSGAAIAAGYCQAALGTDTGASVRIPAALNGVVGLRPSVGAISNRGVFPAAYTQDTVGPMARSALDAARLTEALIHLDAADPYSVASDGAPATSLIGEPIDGLVVGVGRQFFFDDLDDGVGEIVEDFLAWLGANVESTRPVGGFGAADVSEHWTRIVQCEAASIHRDRLLTSPDDFSADVRGRISAGLDVRAPDLARSLDFRVRYRSRLAALFSELDVIVTPVVPIDVPLVGGYDSRKTTAELGRITYPWALHDGPTLTLPIGFHPRSGNPIGIALAASRFAEARLFQIGTAYQAVTEWHLSRAEIPRR